MLKCGWHCIKVALNKTGGTQSSMGEYYYKTCTIFAKIRPLLFCKIVSENEYLLLKFDCKITNISDIIFILNLNAEPGSIHHYYVAAVTPGAEAQQTNGNHC